MSDLEQARTWYSDVAEAYDRFRPRYPEQLIQRAIAMAQLPAAAALLEIGCGPGIATVPFAKLGFSLTCLEPSLATCQIARQNCGSYPQVEIVNTTFEEWAQGVELFDGILAATSFHWVSTAVAYAKAAAILKPTGSLILLWNTAPVLDDELYQALQPIYLADAPTLAKHYTEERGNQEASIQQIGQKVVDSGLFTDQGFEAVPCESVYSVEAYLTLLSTFSPYIALEASQRQMLFERLAKTLEEMGVKMVIVSYFSAFHILQKADLP